MSIVIEFEILKHEASRFFFFIVIAFAIWVFLWFHANFRIVGSISVKNAIEILIGIAVNPYIALGSCF